MMPWRRSLAFRALLVLGGFSLLALSVVGVGGYLLGRRLLEDAVASEVTLVAQSRADEIGRWLDTQEAQLLTITEAPSVQTWTQVISTTDVSSPDSQVASEELSAHLATLVGRLPGIRQLSVLSSPEGLVLASTNQELEGTTMATDRAYTEGLAGLYRSKASVVPTTGAIMMTMSAPLRNAAGDLLGVVIMGLDLDSMQHSILDRAGLRSGWELYLVDSDERRVVGPSTAPGLGLELWPEAVSLIRGEDGGTGVYRNHQDELVIGTYKGIEALDVVLLIEADYAAAVGDQLERLRLSIVGGGFLVVVILGVGIYLLSHHVAESLGDLSRRLSGVIEGEMRPLPVPYALRENEIGKVMRAYNAMVRHFGHRSAEMETQLEEGRASLRRRSRQLQAATRISSAVSAIRDVSALLDEAVRLIPETFDYDHAGIFLIDEARGYARLQAASSEGGQRMLARQHELQLGQGIVGSVAQTGEPRIALDVGEDPVFFDNPDLPLTRSEMAVPLTVRDPAAGTQSVIGVLDVQSNRAGAFSSEDVLVLQSMADQVALAIENARLLEETDQAMRELERRYGERVALSWSQRSGRGGPGYRYTGVAVVPLDTESSQPATREATIRDCGDGLRELCAPILIRDQVLGSVAFRQRVDEEPWDDEDVAMVSALCNHIGQALEHARLLNESQFRARRERLLGDLASRMRETLDTDLILQTAIREIGQTLGVSDIEVRMRGSDR